MSTFSQYGTHSVITTFWRRISIFPGTESCELFCAVIRLSSSTALTDTLWVDYTQKPTTHHPWWSVQEVSDPSRNHSETFLQWRLVLSSVPASRQLKLASNTPSSSPNSVVEFYAHLCAKYWYCQQHLWSFFGDLSQFFVSLLQHCAHCMQWLVDQLEHHHTPILFHFGNDPPTSSLLYSSTHACHKHSLVLS